MVKQPEIVLCYQIVLVCPSVCSFTRSKVVGQCQGQIFWRVAVDTRGSVLPSAAKANNHSKV